MSNLIPFDFHGHPLDVVRLDDGDIGVSLRRLCEAVPVDVDSQAKRLARTAKAGSKWARTVVMTVRDDGGRQQPMTILPRRSIAMWAATVDLGRVREDLRSGITEMLVAFQDECAEVLATHFIDKAAPQEVVTMTRAGLFDLVTGAVTAALVAHDVNTGLIGAQRAERSILSELRTIADLNAQRKSRAWRASHRKLQTDLRDICNIGSCRAWRDLPERYLGDICSHLSVLRTVAERAHREQMDLFDDMKPRH